MLHLPEKTDPTVKLKGTREGRNGSSTQGIKVEETAKHGHGLLPVDYFLVVSICLDLLFITFLKALLSSQKPCWL